MEIRESPYLVYGELMPWFQVLRKAGCVSLGCLRSDKKKSRVNESAESSVSSSLCTLVHFGAVVADAPSQSLWCPYDS